MAGVSAGARQIADMVAEGATPLTDAAAVDAGNRRWPLQQRRVLARYLAEAVEAGLLSRGSDGLLRPSNVAEGPASEENNGSGSEDRPLRAVVVDVESVVRLDPQADDLRDARIYQVGAVRLSTDVAWEQAAGRFDQFCRLPDGWVEDLRSPVVRERYMQHARPVVAVLADLRVYCADADLLIAYNGTTADFPVLDAESARVGLDGPAGRRLDALYLAHALWPLAATHRLAELAEVVGVDLNGLSAHDAADDAEITVGLLRAGAALFAGWPAQLRSLLRSATRGSAGWELIGQLAAAAEDAVDSPVAATARTTRVFDDADVAAVVSAVTTDHPIRRGTDPAGALASPEALVLPADMRGPDGGVRPSLLARHVVVGEVEPRRAQEEMAAALRAWLPRVDGLVEAPAGTGKSLAALAVALEHLAADSGHRVVVATHTKQLQAQLARDVERLAAAVPGLLACTDLVKGKTNRLSLRALVAALVDCTAQPSGRRRRRSRFAERVDFRELVAYLLLRLVAARSPVELWTARSVDAADLPAHFDDYLPRAYRLQLLAVSQDSGEYPPSSPLGQRTDEVADAVAAHRLVLANHALLLAHRDALAEQGQQTLLIIDEAHTLEAAATGAMSAEFDYGQLEQLAADVRAWVNERKQTGPATQAVVGAVDELDHMLDTEVLPRLAMRVLDSRAGAPAAGIGRVTTLASPHAPDGGETEARDFMRAVQRAARFTESVAEALWTFIAGRDYQQLGWFDAERVRMLATRASSAAGAMNSSYDAAAAILGDLTPRRPPGARPADPTNGVPDTGRAAEPVSSDGEGRAASVHDEEVDAGGVDDDLGADAVDRQDEDAAEADEQAVSPTADAVGATSTSIAAGTAAAPNRVVYLDEPADQRLASGQRSYRFAVACAPIELGAEPAWRAFLTQFGRTFLISATLRVAGGFEFIRRRLALPASVVEHVVTTPFDYRRQARLVCFEDFPSWAEQQAGAVRTVAHQLVGYAREVIRAGPEGALDGGALVLTTARRTAADIAQHLAAGLASAGLDVGVHPAATLGNTRAVEEFASRGGLCVGTKGLWQGVDIQPAERLRMVWINKLPFAPFADPIVTARRAAEAERAADEGAADPDLAATERYYLPLAALELRQAVGRLVRSADHAGVVVISDRKLAGATRQRRVYRRIFLESLEEGLLQVDPDSGEPAGANVVPMAEGWRRIWEFLADLGVLERARMETLVTPQALASHVLLPQTLRVRQLELTHRQEARLAAAGDETLANEVVARAAEVGGLLKLADVPIDLKDAQRQAISAAATGNDVLAVLPTGFGKSFTFQLPALVQPGVTIVVSPLVALMTDQALELNQTIGGAVRALVAPLAESVSRRGKTEVAEELSGRRSHGVKMVYMSPERLCQRRVQELIRTAVGKGIVRRVAIDEAHTFVQWGDDFRPSFRRLERFLAQLRRDHRLPITAVTATATRSVLAGLRAQLFGLAGDPADGRPGGSLPDPPSFTFVTEDPMRRELALYRRSLPAGQGGPAVVAGLVERVVDALNDHAILYCLTVKEVEATYAALRDYLGDAGTGRVFRFHGRLPEAEKHAVALEFREAPRRGEEGFAPMLVVATSAFGLGVNRPDVRCVFVVSPPTDLAALYQQLGRAGRDGQVSAGITLGTGRGLRTVRFMTGLGLPAAALERIAARLLKHAAGSLVLDVAGFADDCLGADVASGHIPPSLAARPTTVESYRTGVLRALAALAANGALEDRGDFPMRVSVQRGELIPDPALAVLVDALAPALGEPARVVDVAALHTWLSATVDDYAVLADDPAATWNLLAELHDLGWLDVSQAPCRGRTHVALAANGDTTVPGGFRRRAEARQRRATGEFELLRRFYDDTRCVNTGFADYFEAADPGVCVDAPCRCSSCWGRSAAAGEPLPPLLRALLTPRPRPAASRDAPHRLRRLDDHVRRLLWDNWRGLTDTMVVLVLKGGETYYSTQLGRRRPLWPHLLYHRLRGVDPGLRLADITGSLARLEAAGLVTRVGGRRWRLTAHIERERRRLQAAAVPAAAGSST